MRHFIKLTLAASGGPPVFINPARIVALVSSDASTTVYCGAEDFWRVIEEPAEIDMLVDLNLLKQESEK